jgi:low affinity Fe/Cu permease
MLALAAVMIWAVTGPIFDYSETWQLVINTGTTIITFEPAAFRIPAMRCWNEDCDTG